ncbi:Kinesin light chain 3 [Borealophlyctis nickersoniae]|nr:Kinesin light chain 3 [Borealophlyctis nickersoniae]
MLGQTPGVGPNSGPLDTPPTDAQTAIAEISTPPAAATATVPPLDSSAPAAAVPSNTVDAAVLDQPDPAKAAANAPNRPSSSDQLDGFSLLGVRLSFFDTFIDEWCGGREKIDGWKTEDVCEKVVKQRTDKSVCDHLVEEDSSEVGRATWFISHAWKYEFLDVVDAVKHHFESSTPDVIVWFDLFSNSQHDIATKPFTWYTGTITNAISELGSVLMILHPWNNPETLKRAWCVFELYACKCDFAIALPPRHTPAFRTSLRDNPEAFNNTLATIKSANSIAFKKSDQLTIHKAIRKTVGFSALDRMVLSVLFNWMVSTLRSHILLTEKAGDEVEHAIWLSSLAILFMDQGSYEEAEPLCVDSLEIFRRVLGGDHPDTLSPINHLARLYMYQGKDEKAEPLYVECLERMTRVLGEDHPYTLESLNGLASAYQGQGKYEKAEPMYVDCLDRMKRVLGEDHPDTLLSIGNLAGLYTIQEKYEAAEPLFVDCLEGFRRVLGEDHPKTLMYINGLALVYESQGKYEKAEPLYLDCLQRTKRVLGEDHPDTLFSISNLARLYYLQGEYEKAEPLYVDCLEGRIVVLGEDHPATLSSIDDACLYDRQGRYEKAEPLYVDCLERRRVVLGEDHRDTLVTINSLARMYRDQGEYEKAEPLYVEYLERTKRVFGEDHPYRFWPISDFAVLYENQGEYEKAEPLYVECLERMTRVLGEDHPDTQTVMEYLALLRAKAEQ